MFCAALRGSFDGGSVIDDIDGRQQVSWSTQVAVFQLTHLSLTVTDGTEGIRVRSIESGATTP